MSTRNLVWAATIAAVTIAAGSLQSFAAASPNLGVPISEEDISAWNLDVGPDGEGLPRGEGTAKEGKSIYVEKCQACHGEEGVGAVSDALVGGTLDGERPLKTVGSYWPYATTLFDYVRRAMPLTEPESLTADEVYAVSAYILFLNNIIDEATPMNATSLPKVEMPNRDAFFTVYPGKLQE